MKNEMRPYLRSTGATTLKQGIPVLDGRGRRNDRDALCVAFNGGCVFDGRGGRVISAPTMAELPPGLYRLIDDKPTK